MRYTKLGNSGLSVSKICLGAMSFGTPDRGPHAWTMNEEDSRIIIKNAIDAGINFFDTANIYSAGSSEEILGSALNDFVPRDEVVIATKLNGAMRKDVNAGGLSRKAVMTEIDHSLRRLGTDYVDLYQIHRFDRRTPVEETMEALHDVVKAGKVRYIGASSMYAWQFSKMQYTAELNGWTKFISMQDHYNLLQREEEREMLPLCIDQGVGVIPWSPLARGRLTRPWDTVSARSETDEFGQSLYQESDKVIVERVTQVAVELGVSAAQIALAWVLAKPGVTSPIVGVTKPHHLADAIKSIDVVLSPDDMSTLEQPYTPRAIAGFQ